MIGNANIKVGIYLASHAQVVFEVGVSAISTLCKLDSMSQLDVDVFNDSELHASSSEEACMTLPFKLPPIGQTFKLFPAPVSDPSVSACAGKDPATSKLSNLVEDMYKIIAKSDESFQDAKPFCEPQEDDEEIEQLESELRAIFLAAKNKKASGKVKKAAQKKMAKCLAKPKKQKLAVAASAASAAASAASAAAPAASASAASAAAAPAASASAASASAASAGLKRKDHHDGDEPFELDGYTHVKYGSLGTFAFKDGQLNAHCNHSNHNCKKPYVKCHMDKSGGGRYLGLLGLWLEKSQDVTFFERSAHACRKFKKLLGTSAYWAERKAARQRLKLLPTWKILAVAESPKDVDDDDSEPEYVRA